MKSIIVICLIKVVTCGFPVSIETEIDGKLLKEENNLYYVDFSDSTRAQKYCSKLDKKLVPKNKCIKQ